MSEPRMSHQECWELLPWLANGSLDAAEAMRIAEHLEVCAICREEERACRELAGLLEDGATAAGDDDGLPSEPAETAVELSPERAFSRLRARLDAGPGSPRRRRFGELLTATPAPIRFLLAAQMAALLVLAALAGWGGLGAAAPEGADPATPTTFRTLSSPGAGDAAGAADRQRLRLVFAEETALAEVRQLLVESGARLVDGPSPFGVYTIELPASAGRGETAGERLERLRRHPAVVFAEPAAAPPAPGAGSGVPAGS